MGLNLENEVVKTPKIISNNPVYPSARNNTVPAGGFS